MLQQQQQQQQQRLQQQQQTQQQQTQQQQTQQQFAPSSSRSFVPRPPSSSRPSANATGTVAAFNPTLPASSPSPYSLNLSGLTGFSGDGSSSLTGFADPLLSAPALPRRYRDGTFKRTTSEYCYTYRNPADYAAQLGSGAATERAAATKAEEEKESSSALPAMKVAPRTRGRMQAPRDSRYYEDPSVSARLRPEQHSFRLWGRINNAHCVLPYETESQRSYGADTLNGHRDPLDTSRHLTVMEKEYKEAFVKAKFTRVIRGDKAVK